MVGKEANAFHQLVGVDQPSPLRAQKSPRTSSPRAEGRPGVRTPGRRQPSYDCPEVGPSLYPLANG